MNKKKTIAVAAVLLLVSLIGGMLAYFTDTDTKTNTFTIGDNIEITVNESNWVSANAQGIHPGATIAKNPTIHNDSTTTPAYVFMKVEVPCYATTGTTVDAPLFTFTANPEWALINTPTPNTTTKTITYIYAYGTTSAMTSLAANTTTPAVFNSVTLESTLTESQKATAPISTNSTSVIVTGYGIQTDGLSTSVPSQIFTEFN